MSQNERSKSIAAIVGPVLTLMVVSELHVWNPSLYDEQIVPLIYLSGVLLLTAGVSIVRAHNIWLRAWPVTITILGWFSIALGLWRMFFPQAYRSYSTNGSSALGVEIFLICIGLFLSLKAYWKSP